MRKSDYASRDEIISKVSWAFVNILETLFILRKWKMALEEHEIETTVACFLRKCPDSFWEEIDPSGLFSPSEKAKEVVRIMDKSLALRELSRNEIIKAFSSPLILGKFMKRKELTYREEKYATSEKRIRSFNATAVSRSIRDRSSQRKKGQEESKNGMPRIGKKTRIYSSSLTSDQFRDRLLYWASHREELY